MLYLSNHKKQTKHTLNCGRARSTSALASHIDEYMRITGANSALGGCLLPCSYIVLHQRGSRANYQYIHELISKTE